MSYGTKYRATAKDYLGRTVQVDFQLDGYAGGVTPVRLASGGLKRRWGAGKSDAFGLKPQLRSYRLAARDAAAAEEMATTGTWRTREFVGGALFGQWEVIREESERGLSLIPEAADVAARCGLGRLSELSVATTYDEARALLDAGPKPLLWWLLTALSKTVHQLDVETIIERTCTGAAVALEDVYARPDRWVKITYNGDSEAEADSERYEIEASTWADVATDVAAAVGGVLAQHGGRWRLAERSAFYSAAPDGRIYDHDAHLTDVPAQESPLPVVHEAAPRTLLSGGRLLERSGRPEVHVTYDPGETGSMFPPDAFPPNEWALNLSPNAILPDPGTVLRGPGGSYYVGMVTLLNDVPPVPIIASPAVQVLAGDKLGLGFTALAAPNVSGDRSYTLFWRMLLDAGDDGLYVLREVAPAMPYLPRELQWHPVASAYPLLANSIPATLTNNVSVRIEREIPPPLLDGTIRWDVLAILDTNGAALPPGFSYEKVAAISDVVMLPTGGGARTYAARLLGAEARPAEAAEAHVMRLGRGPSASYPGCLLTASRALAGNWGVGSQAKWPLAEHEARFRLEQFRNGQAERRCAYRLTPSSPVLCVEDEATGEVFQWTEGEADDLRVSVEGTALEVRVDSLTTESVPIKLVRQGSFGGGTGDVGTALARVIEAQDQQLARIAQQNAIALTTEWMGPGEITGIWVTHIERPQEVLRQGSRILVVDRRTAKPYTFTLAQRQEANADFLWIETFDLGAEYISPDSGVYPVATDLLNVQTFTAEATRSVITADALCELAADTSGTVTSLSVTPLREAIRSGQRLAIHRLSSSEPGDAVACFADGDHAKNATTLAIRAAEAPESGGLVVDAAGGAAVRIPDVQRQSEMLQTATEIALRVRKNEIVSEMNVQFDRISFDTYRVCSENWDGVVIVDEDGICTIDEPGTAGWCITNSGQAEFNDVQVRGSMTARDLSTPYLFVNKALPVGLGPGGFFLLQTQNGRFVSAYDGALIMGGNAAQIDETATGAVLRFVGPTPADDAVLRVSKDGAFITRGGTEHRLHDAGSFPQPKHTTGQGLPSDHVGLVGTVPGSTHITDGMGSNGDGLYVLTGGGWWGPLNPAA